MRARGGLTRLARFWPWVAAIATGFLYAACFPPLDQQWLCWICLTPLIAAVWFSGRNARRPWLRHLLLGYVSGIVFITTTFSWLGSLGILFESVWLRGLPLLLSLYMGLYLGFWSWFVGGIAPKNFVSSGRNLLCAFFAAAAWVPTEWIRGWLLGGFGWNGLGVALHAQWPLIQIAEFTGVAGLSFVIAFANVIAVTTPIRLYLEARTHRMRPHWDLNITMLAVMALLVWGWHVAHIPHPSKPFQVAAVQPGVPQKEKFKGQSPAEILERCRRLSTMALQMNPPPGLLIWPESATPGPLFGDEQTHRFIMDFAASANTDLLLGTDEITEDRAYNTAVLLSDRGQNAQVYRKVHLVSFGEYVPLRHSFPLFAAVARRWVPGDFDAGNEYTVFQITNSDVRVAPLICFEDTVGELARRFVLPADDKPGANLLVNITNDGWFLHSVGAQQHLANAVFRCVELRRPMVRAANTGVTCFVNEFGRVTQILQDDVGSTFNEGVLAGEVNIPTNAVLTFYARHGEWFTNLCMAITLLALAWRLAWQKRGRGQPPNVYGD